MATSIVQMESNPHREHKAAPMPEPPTNPEADMEFAGRTDMIFLKNQRMGPWTLSFSSGLQNHIFQILCIYKRRFFAFQSLVNANKHEHSEKYGFGAQTKMTKVWPENV